jgi:hypothetical protein
MNKINRIFEWVPRVIGILSILFIIAFAADAFLTESVVWEKFDVFLQRIIPALLLIFILIMAWKRELTGGILFVIVGIVFTPVVFYMNYKMNHSVSLSLSIVSIITIPFILVGALFILSYYFKNSTGFLVKNK